MKSVKISLEMAQKVKEFVAITQDCPYEILLKSGKYVVDAKSILGIFSLDLSQPLTVEIYSDDCEAFLEKLKKSKVVSAGRFSQIVSICTQISCHFW